MGKVLSVIDSAYRASLEEQDDAGLWFSAAVAKAGVEITLLLTGNAVNYATTGHSSKPLKLGGGEIAHPMDPNVDIKRAAGFGCTTFFVKEDAQERGIEPSMLMDGVEGISRDGLADFVDKFDDVWHW
jgi:hypothetical protein